MTEIQIGEHLYQIGQLEAMKQFHIARRLAPVLAALFKNASSMPDGKDNNAIEAFLMNSAEPLAEALSEMSDEQVEHIVFPCLAAVKRQEGPAWVDVKTPGRNSIMYPDIDGITLIRLTTEVVKANLANFFSGLKATQQNSSEQAKA